MNWKVLVGILIAFIFVATSVPRLTRRVPRFEPPMHRELLSWGTLDREKARALQSVLDEKVNSLKVPGLQAFVRTPDGKTWSGTSGTTDLARKDPLRRDHVMRVGSVTKSFTAVLILKLIEEGQLGLDEPVAKWSPELPNAEAITVRHLLNHTSGIPDIIPRVMMRSIMPWTTWELKELAAMGAKNELLFAPGSDFAYSNTNYILLGMIAEEVSGRTFDELLHEQILDPLNLTNTSFIPYEEAPADLVPGWDRDFSSFPGMLDIGVNNTSWATSAFASGALASTADDLGVFFQHLVEGAILSSSMMKEMTTFMAAPNPDLPAQNGYGLGLMRLEVGGQELYGHVGWFMGSTSIAMVAPDDGTVIAVTSNLSRPDLVQVLAELQASIE